MLLLALATCASAVNLLSSQPAQPAQLYHSYDLDDSVWGGDDEVAVDHQLPANGTSSLKNVESFHEESSNASAYLHYVQLYGPFNTGTNLLQQLLQKNFPGQIFVREPVWKHSSLRNLLKEQPHVRSSLASSGPAIAVVRDPLSWLQSMKKAGYDLKSCTESPMWLQAGCRLPEKGGLYSTNGCLHCSSVPAHRRPVMFDDLMHFWNSYTEDYLNLASFGPTSFTVMRYEDLVFHTEDLMDRVADLVGIPHPANFKQQEASAKNHGSSNGRQKAIDKLNSKSYMAAYLPGEVSTACAGLDGNVLHKEDYHDCDNVNR